MIGLVPFGVDTTQHVVGLSDPPVGSLIIGHKKHLGFDAPYQRKAVVDFRVYDPSDFVEII